MSKKAIVIGAGIAGIAAAIAATEKGYKTTVIESRQYIGGRARSFVDKTTGEIIDNGQHVMMGCYHNMLRIIRTLGTDRLIYRQKALKVLFYDSDGSGDVLDSGKLPGKLGIAAGIMGLRKVSLQSRLRALLFAMKLGLSSKQKVGETSLQYLKRMNQSDEMIHRLWEPLIIATLNARPEEADATLLIEVLKRAFFGGKEASQLVLPRVGLSELVEPLMEWIKSHGGEIRLSTSVENLKMNDKGIVSVILDNEEELYADIIISTVPAFALRRFANEEVLGAQSFTLLNDLVFSPIVSIYLWFDQDFMEESFCAMLNTTTQWVFNRRRIADSEQSQKDKYPGHISLTISAGNELVTTAPEKVVQQCWEEIKQCFPKANSASLKEWKVIKEKQATFLATPSIESRRPVTITKAKNFYIAGDWTATGLPATLEGAAQSGFEAVRIAVST